MNILLTLTLMFTMSAVHAAALEQPASHKKSTSVFSKEQETELQIVRGKIIIAHSKRNISLDQRNTILRLHDLWSHNKKEFNDLSVKATGEETEFLDPVLQSFASLDQAISGALKQYAKIIDDKTVPTSTSKDDKKS